MQAPMCTGFPSIRPPGARHVDPTRRRELLAGLRDLVLAVGFTQAGMDDLAARLQCSKSTLYAIAAGKVPLVAMTLREFFDEVHADVDKLVAELTDPVEAITTYLTVLGARLRRLSPACYTDIMAYGLTRDVYLAHSLAVAFRLREHIDQGVRTGIFRPLHTPFLTEAVNLTLDGIQEGDLLVRAGLSPAGAYLQLRDLLVATLTNTGYRRPAGPDHRNHQEQRACDQ
jgi:AcrR family transcriptional regulator